MVQRKLNKLGIGIQVHADQLKYDHKLSTGLRPLSPRLQYGINKGTDHLRMKMKKSRSIKHTDVETLKPSSGFRKEIKRVSEPGRPPPATPEGVHTCPGTSQKQPGDKTNDVLPNYMKSTTCFDARKERFQSQSQVSNQNSQTGSFSRNLHRHKSSSPKRSPDYCNTSTKTLKRSSSLKLGRTLTRTPSFKLARSSSAKKCSKIVLCDDMDAHRATCSSTMKDSKFPKYLELNPGGIEAERTSIMKVCPYSYCSLNGHHHAPLPPLKCFLSARRRMMKAQKSFKVEALSPRRRLKASSAGDQLESQDSAVATNFFIEVYTKNQSADEIVIENAKEVSADENKDGDQIVADGPAEERRSDGHFPGEPPHSEIDLLDSIPEEEERGSNDADEISSAVLLLDETMLWSSSEKDGHEDKSKGGTEAQEGGSEVTDMELVIGQYTLQTPEEESDYSTERDGTLAFDYEYLSEADGPDMHEKPELCSDFSVINWKFFPFDDDIDGGKEHAFLEAGKLIALCFHSEDSYQSSEISEYSQESDCLSHDQCSTTDNDEMEVAPTMDSPGDDESISKSKTYDKPGYIQHKGDAEYEPTKAIAESQEAVGEWGADSDAEEHNPEHNLVGPILQIEAQDRPSNPQTAHVAENLNVEIDQLDTRENTNTSALQEFEQQEHAGIKNSNLDDSTGESDMVELKRAISSEVDESTLITDDVTGTQEKSTLVKPKKYSPEELLDSKLKWTTKRKRLSDTVEDLRGFNPREPNYLPLVPNPEAEKVDLKHQTMDERKNSEEWMIDYALRQAVTKLAPARKRKVALLVEAFEKVMPIPKCETHLRSTSTGFPHARPMQACN